ncbi:UvrD-helicase domain-containing protein [Xanthomonas translucens]|uniref:UvrD-helicase domain-containing protein n=1 Tax=Xanthomonas campestris pv. translucens TaxID=343 RepID=UPI00071B2CE9|nr:UvrD-helicase domain-containing protein [Xanthomonas translucens]
MALEKLSPAAEAAQKAQQHVNQCIDHHQCFRLEAGAGAGKTYSLVQALNRLISERGSAYLRRGQKVACITYTNGAKSEISQKIDEHPVVLVETIHSFCWGCIAQFQSILRNEVGQIQRHAEKIAEAGGVGNRNIEYDLGYFGIHDDRITLYHDDIPELMARFLAMPKFQQIFTGSYPVVLIDEYQDTNEKFMSALATHFLEPKKGPLIGLFGDHWQTIYRDDFDLAALPNVEGIDKGSNFRSVPAVVDMLNRLRPALPQVVDDETATGEARAFHANSYTGERTDTAHSKLDTPPDITRAYVAALRKQLQDEGWDFSPGVTKVLMLTHAALAAEQGYPSVAEIFKSHQDAISKLDDATLEFLGRVIEPACAAYKAKKYGLMFDVLGQATTLRKHSEKLAWADDMMSLDALRENGTVGEVLDLLKKTRRPRLPDNVIRREEDMAAFDPAAEEPEKRSVDRHRRLREVKYQEIVNLVRFVDGFTPFATQHSVKGAEFENVLVVCGGGWNQYNWPRMLEYMDAGAKPTAAHQKGFNRARNLFYVGVSRPKRRLAVLFTQTMSDKSLAVLNTLFANKVAEVNLP